jgi:ribosomal protein S1
VHWFKTTNLISSLSNDIVLSSEVGEWLHVLNTRTDLPPWAEARRCLDEGVPIKGQVTAVLSHSCSVQLEIGLVAILENSPISVRREKGFEHPFFVYKLNPDKGFVLVGLEKSVSLIVGGIYEGRVTGVKGFGVFVRIGQYEGLLHRTKLSADTNVLTQFSMGQSLRVQVRSFRPNGRIEFSLPPR